MGCGTNIGCGPVNTNANCVDKFGCPPNTCPDFVIKRHDNKPAFKVSVEDCDGPLDLTEDGIIAEVNIWAKAKLKKAITDSDTYFGFADNIGFEQVMVGDIILMDRVRLAEQMLVTGFDETNKFIQVVRGYNGTTESSWDKGTPLKIFRTMSAAAEITTIHENILQVDGTTLTNQLTNTFLVYEWSANDTCVPGCFWLEFKVLKMSDSLSLNSLATVSATPSFTPSNFTSSDFGCDLSEGVEWIRRFPATGEGFLIKIVNSPTAD